jgi:hypothetical protein
MNVPNQQHVIEGGLERPKKKKKKPQKALARRAVR